VHVDGSLTTSRADLSNFTVAAYIPDSGQASGFKIVTGTVGTDGTLTVPDVPAGASYYLRIQNPTDPLYPWPHYFFTDQRKLDLGYLEIGRDDTPTTGTTNVTFTVSSMSPWTPQGAPAYSPIPGDGFSIESFSTGSSWGSSTMPAAGATSASALVDWKGGSGEQTFADLTSQAARLPQLVDTTKGDDLWLLHTRNAPIVNGDQPDIYSTIVDAAQITGTIQNGTPVTLAAAMQPAPKAATDQTLTINLDAFRAAFHDENRYLIENISCSRATNPGANVGLVEGVLWSLNNGGVFGAPSSYTMSQPYSNPFPTTWPQMMTCSIGHFRNIRTPGTNKGVSALSYIYGFGPANDSVNLLPGIHAVTNVLVGGKPGLPGGGVAFDGVKPVTISWDPIAGVSHYEVRVLGSASGFVGVFDTAQTSLSIPADTFTKGDFYVFRIFAIQTPIDYAQGHLLRFTAPLWVSRAATGLFRFSDKCGNGTVDPGEDCDPGTAGDTATCDADCSAVKCGDGYLNAAAGEQCDDVADSAHCNQCKPVVCGDGIWNQAAEECDDGNTVNGDGCDSKCRLEHCGDHMIQMPFENCDDGNRVNGDGCSALCQPEM
jgi:cysteine-rich repeat protein